MNNRIFNSERMLLQVYFDALAFAAHKHRFQKRKGAFGIPYINHPIEVTNLLVAKLVAPSQEVILAGILHDTLEDTKTEPGEIGERYGHKVLSLVQEVSDDMRLSSAKRKQLQVEHAGDLSPEARAIKIADKTCNIHDVLTTRIQWTKKKKASYIRWAIRVIDQISDSHPELKAEFEKVIREAEKNLHLKLRD